MEIFNIYNIVINKRFENILKIKILVRRKTIYCIENKNYKLVKKS